MLELCRTKARVSACDDDATDAIRERASRLGSYRRVEIEPAPSGTGRARWPAEPQQSQALAAIKPSARDVAPTFEEYGSRTERPLPRLTRESVAVCMAGPTRRCCGAVFSVFWESRRVDRAIRERSPPNAGGFHFGPDLGDDLSATLRRVPLAFETFPLLFVTLSLEFLPVPEMTRGGGLVPPDDDDGLE
jgi:hypothetical protein